MFQVYNKVGAEAARQGFLELHKSGLEQAGINASNIAARPTANRGIYEIDMNPQAGKFTNPDMAINSKGEVVIPYANISNHAASFEKALKEAGLSESKDSNGVYHFYDAKNKEVQTFEGYCAIALYYFADLVPFRNDDVSQSEASSARRELVGLLKEAKLVPDIANLFSFGSLTGVSTGFFSMDGARIPLELESPDGIGNGGFMENFLFTLRKGW
ncbi:MAG: hypothetical protein WC717_06190 [Candidatus Micrarchaeia archaeon]